MVNYEQGNIYALPKFLGNLRRQPLPAFQGDLNENQNDWFDTRYVLAMDTASTHWWKCYLVYKYEVYGTKYLDDGGEKRDEEPEEKEPPRFCNGFNAFTIAETSLQYLQHIEDTKLEGRRVVEGIGLTDLVDLEEIPLRVVSTKKPSLAVAGYKDADHPYVPVFSPRDSKIDVSISTS